MKTGIKTIATVSALLAAATVVEAQPQRQRQGKDKRQLETCPCCGSHIGVPQQQRQGGNRQQFQQFQNGNRQQLQQRGQVPGAPQWQSQTPANPRIAQMQHLRQQRMRQQQFQGRQPQAQNRRQQMQRTPVPQQFQGQQPQAQRQSQGRRQLTPQQRQKILQRFDRDGDGRLSEQERTVLKKRMQSRQRQSTGDEPKRKARRQKEVEE